MYDGNQWAGTDPKAFFSDTTEEYVTPPQPDLYDRITIRLRTGREGVRSCFLVMEDTRLLMKLCGEDHAFSYYEVTFEVTVCPLRYYFEIAAGERVYRYTRRGVRNTVRPPDLWHLLPGFHPPAWAEGAVMYQIFVDRFRNGDPSNDVLSGEYRYEGKPVVQVKNWSAPPGEDGFRQFYGGDLQGVIDKLDYLQNLGVDAIYLNPIFLSPSSHKYDTQDYEHIDPHFGKIVRDQAAGGRSRSNRKAARYLKRVTSPENLAASDRLFAKLVKQAHARGIRVILDGVFNHCGSFHRWMDAEKIYEQLPGGRKGARASKRSPYVPFFHFTQEAWPNNSSYDAWWDFKTLPKLNYENSEALCEYILEIARKWVSPPYNADGWRLDVAADLGYTEKFNHSFWKRFRKAVREANPEAVIIAENYKDSRKWLQGDEWDTIMNYEFFMEPVTCFLTGMEKHSDALDDENYGDPDSFWDAVLYKKQTGIPDAALRISMNQLSNHDHSRFLTRTNRMVGRVAQLGADAALRGVHMEVMRQAVLLQMTWIGAPAVYYGDEAGLGGFTDPDSRRTYPWGQEDRMLLQYHRILISLRRAGYALRHGSLLRLPDMDGVLAYARFCRGTEKNPHSESYIILININQISVDYNADLTYAGVPREACLTCLLQTDRNGYREPLNRLPVAGGFLHLDLPPGSGFLLRWRKP